MDHRIARSVSAKTSMDYGRIPIGVPSRTGAQCKTSSPFRSRMFVLPSACCSIEGSVVQLEARYRSVEEALPIARQYAMEGHLHQAFLAYSLAVEMDEASAPLNDEFGQFLLAHGQLDGAENLFHQALALDPLNPEYCYHLGVVLQQKRQLGQAIDAFSNALRQDPQFVGALFNLGVVHRELGDHQRASEHFRRILHIDPENHSAQALLGECLAELGDMDGAIRAVEESLRLDPDNRAAQKDLQLLRKNNALQQSNNLKDCL